ncbi:MAG TPA: diaminopimelate epimerase [Vicinamibacteria bacterium]|jgi:diaminopimelate epimerase
MEFAKAHGLGNDFLLVDARSFPARSAASFTRRLCDRHAGVGADGVLVYELRPPGGVQMRLINADGSDAEISGNGVRCLAAYMVRRGLLPARHTVETVPGPRAVEVFAIADGRYRVSTDLGAPALASDAIPVDAPEPRATVIDQPLEAAGRTVSVTATSLGNPHCSVFVEEPASDELMSALGPALERHPFFPKRTNVEFVTVLSRQQVRARFWERGVGPTRASGTGAAAAMVASVLKGLTDRRVRVECDGGTLDVEWPEDSSVKQTGEVEVLFEGRWVANSAAPREGAG